MSNIELGEELLALSRKRSMSKIAERLKAVGLYFMGEMTYEEIGERLGRNKVFVFTWLKRYKDEGLAGLNDRPGRGRKENFSPEELGKFLERVKAGPQEFDNISVFTLEALVKIVKEEFGKTFTDGGLSKLLHRQGLSRIKPRPYHPKNDRAAMTEFREKALPLFMRKQAKKTLIKKSA